MGSLGSWVTEEAGCAAVVVVGKCKLGSVARCKGRAVTKQLPHSKTHNWGENNELPLLSAPGVVWGANAGRAQALAAASASPPAPPPPWAPRPYLDLLVRRPSNACLAAPALHHLTAPLTVACAGSRCLAGVRWRARTCAGLSWLALSWLVCCRRALAGALGP
eukprot:scaffold122236_cov51-Phaeocystis_antarctica.AAC.1